MSHSKPPKQVVNCRSFPFGRRSVKILQKTSVNLLQFIGPVCLNFCIEEEEINVGEDKQEEIN